MTQRLLAEWRNSEWRKLESHDQQGSILSALLKEWRNLGARSFRQLAVSSFFLIPTLPNLRKGSHALAPLTIFLSSQLFTHQIQQCCEAASWWNDLTARLLLLNDNVIWLKKLAYCSWHLLNFFYRIDLVRRFLLWISISKKKKNRCYCIKTSFSEK